MAEMYYPISKTRLSFRSLVLMSLLAAAPVMAAPQEGTTSTRFEAYGEAFNNITKAPKSQARVYAYRTDIGSTQPINLYLNGRYHASLLRGGYSEFCLAPAKLNMQTALDDAAQMHMGKLQAGTPLNAQAGQPLYLRVQDNGARPASVQSVTEQQAITDLRRTRRQIHTISRAPEVQECSTDLVADAPVVQTPPPPPPPKPVPQREYALETDALFEFGKAELKASGFNAIETLVQQVRQDYTHFERIRVIGYTDAIGPVNLNKRLSQQRADAVAQRLGMKGLRATQGIQAEGRWSLELAKTNCKNTPTPENKACHAPNRRVVIVVYGLRR